MVLLSHWVVLFSCIWFFFYSPLLSLGEKLEREEVDILIKECCDPEDDDGFIPYERKLLNVQVYRRGQTDGIPSAVVSTHAWHLLFQLSWGVCARAPTPRCTRTGNSPNTIQLNKQPSKTTTLCEHNIQLSTTAGCINNYTNQKTKLSTSNKMRTEVASC